MVVRVVLRRGQLWHQTLIYPVPRVGYIGRTGSGTHDYCLSEYYECAYLSPSERPERCRAMYTCDDGQSVVTGCRE